MEVENNNQETSDIVEFLQQKLTTLVQSEQYFERTIVKFSVTVFSFIASIGHRVIH